MYRIDTSTGYSLVRIEQIRYAGLTQLPIADGRFNPNWLISISQNHATVIG